MHPTFRLNNLILSYADILLHGQRSTITKKAGEAQAGMIFLYDEYLLC